MKKILITLLILVFLMNTGFSQSYRDFNYPLIHFEEWQNMNHSKEATKNWFRDAKFGMFIHWGLYSIPGGIWKGKKIHDMRSPHVAEWIMHAAKIPREEYAQLAAEFNPTKFSADEIAKLAKDAGMKYIVITSKHHDGFALFDSKCSEYDIMDASPFKRDIIEELHSACKKQGLEFGVYYSHNIDWYDGSDAQSELSAILNPDLPEFNRTFGANTWDPSPNSFEEYLINKAFPQVKELMNQYPDMKLLWYDMPWRMNGEQSYGFYKNVYEIQPQILVNQRIGNGFGDYIITGDNTIPKEYKHIYKPWETIGTFNNSWGYNVYDKDFKTPDEVLYWLIEIVSKGGNYMLNIGPTAEGVVPGESVNTLQEIGKWMAVNGESIYGTKRWEVAHEGPTDLIFQSTEDREKKGFKNVFTPEDFWFTLKGDHIYAIALKYPENKVLIKSLSKGKVGEINKVQMLGSQSEIQWNQTDEGLEIMSIEEQVDKNGYVLKVQFQ